MAKLSIVVPVYFNEQNLPDTVPQLLALEEKLPKGDELELVFVDDGSGDGSLKVLLEQQAKAPGKVVVVKLARNFGSMSAILAGLAHATGDCVGMIACDLQDPPELFLDMHQHWRNGSRVVLAVRADREEPLGQRMFAATYYTLLRKFALAGYPKGGFDFFLIDRRVVTQLLEIREKNTNLMSLIFWLGFSPVMLPYVRRARDKGVSRWTMSKKIKLFVDSFVAFSYVPIRFFSLLGFVVALASFVYGGVVLYSYFFDRIPVQGYAPLMLVASGAAGIQMVMLGILGEYLWRALDESRRRPVYVIDDVYPKKP